MKRYSILILIILSVSQNTSGQPGTYYVPNGSGTYTSSSSPCLDPSTPSSLPCWYVNLEKYWFYRYRLVNDFTFIGPNPGEDMIAYRRVKGDLASASAVGQAPNSLDFAADQTIDLGNYMAVLATEYAQLKNHGFSTAQTLYEIQYAQNAFDRLRYYSWHNSPAYYTNMPTTANVYPPTTQPLVDNFSTPSDATSNGFFIRDDVPFLNFLDELSNPLNLLHWQHFNRPALINLYPAGATYGGVTYSTAIKEVTGPGTGNGAIMSGYHGTSPLYPAPSGHYPNQESQDQLNQIFIGEALLVQYLNDPSDPMVVAQRARCAYSLAHTMEFVDNTCGSPYTFWGIPDPDAPSHWPDDHVYWLHTDEGVFYFSATAAMWGLTNVLHTGGPVASSLSGHAATLEHQASLIAPYTAYVAEMAGDPLPCDYTSQNIVFTDGYTCFGPELSLHVSCSLPFFFHYLCAALTGWLDWAAWQASPVSVKDWFSFIAVARHANGFSMNAPHLPLLFELANNTDYSYLWPHGNNYVESILNSAPSCGPWCYESSNYVESLAGGEDWCNNTNLAYANSDWSGNNRLTDADHRQGLYCGTALEGCDRSGGVPYAKNDMGSDCDFNGLDYMWLFNLYGLERDMASSSYMEGMMNSYYCEHFAVNYPDPSCIGSTSQELKLNWLEYLSANDQIAGSGGCGAGWVDFRGAQVIDLKPQTTVGGTSIPGFWAHQGSFFYAHIKDYNCSGGDNGDGPYNFAELNTSRFGGHSRSATTDTGWRPIAYYQPGYDTNNAPKGEVVTSEPDLSQLSDIMNNPMQYIQSHKDEVMQLIDAVKQSPYLQQLMGYSDSSSDSLNYYANILFADSTASPDLVIIMPNPTLGISYLSYTVSYPSTISIKLTNAIGQDLSYLIDSYDKAVQPGQYKVTLNTDKVTPGMYYVTININGQLISKKISVIN